MTSPPSTTHPQLWAELLTFKPKCTIGYSAITVPGAIKLAIVHLGLNVSSSAHNCGGVVDSTQYNILSNCVLLIGCRILTISASKASSRKI